MKSFKLLYDRERSDLIERLSKASTEKENFAEGMNPEFSLIINKACIGMSPLLNTHATTYQSVETPFTHLFEMGNWEKPTFLSVGSSDKVVFYHFPSFAMT